MCSFPVLLSLCEYQALRKSPLWKLQALSTIVTWSKSILWTNWFMCCATLELLSPTRTTPLCSFNLVPRLCLSVHTCSTQSYNQCSRPWNNSSALQRRRFVLWSWETWALCWPYDLTNFISWLYQFNLINPFYVHCIVQFMYQIHFIEIVIL